ncbi:MAG: aldo/keto reductase [Armatimonadota bacterium]
MSETTAVMPQQNLGADGPRISRIGLGCMGLSGTWNPAEVGPENVRRAVAAFEAALEVGINFFDHADIYGGGSCESVFSECLKAVPGSRDRIVIATKCGIRPGFYNLTRSYIIEALGKSLYRLGVEYVDLYQLHRPDPLAHPAETARALNELLRQGRIRAVGVSNYYPEQIRALQEYLHVPIRSNQISISLMRLEPIYEGWDLGGMGVGDGTLDQCMAMGMTPLAYSPLAGGRLAREPAEDADPRLKAVYAALKSQAEKHNATPTQIALAWLLRHPSGIVPLVGSVNPDHIREVAGSVRVNLTREDWYELFTASWGRRVP